MPISVEVDRDARCVLVEATGSVTNEERLSALGACLDLLRAQGPLPVLFDGVGATSHPSTNDVQGLVRSAAAVAPLFAGGVALALGQPVQFGMARMLETLLEQSGIAAAVFPTREAATSWIMARRAAP